MPLQLVHWGGCQAQLKQMPEPRLLPKSPVTESSPVTSTLPWEPSPGTQWRRTNIVVRWTLTWKSYFSFNLTLESTLALKKFLLNLLIHHNKDIFITFPEPDCPWVPWLCQTVISSMYCQVGADARICWVFGLGMGGRNMILLILTRYEVQRISLPLQGRAYLYPDAMTTIQVQCFQINTKLGFLLLLCENRYLAVLLVMLKKC